MADPICASCQAAIAHHLQTERPSCPTCGSQYVAGMPPPQQQQQGHAGSRRSSVVNRLPDLQSPNEVRFLEMWVS